MHKVTLANGVEFLCAETQTILEAARQNKVAIEHSCMSGRCGICVAVVSEGDTTAIKSEDAFSDDAKNAEKILTCCRAPTGPIKLDIEDLGDIGQLQVRTLPCKVDSLSHFNDDVLNLVLRLPPGSEFNFYPGQYVDLIHGDVRRSYSIANAPRIDGKLELQVKKVAGGYMSDILFSRAKINDLFRIEGPLGTFSYRDNKEENIIFMATGTGIAPIKAFLEAEHINLKEKNVFVAWGMRRKEDFYLDFDAYERVCTFIKVLSREQHDGYFFGYVQDAIMNLNMNLSTAVVYACGSEQMISDSFEWFTKKGLSPSRFYSDAFVSSS